MKVLGIETSCDETAAAILKDGSHLLSSIISDQIIIHSKYGGVVPELAGRSHVESIHQVIEKSLNEAKVTLKQIARELDVSISTVSKSLRNSPEISEDTRQKVQAFAKLYNYRPNFRTISKRF